jgi:hypothetical protein
MPDVPARIGVPVFKILVGGNPDYLAFIHDRSDDPDRGEWLSVPHTEPGLWFASTPEAVAEMRANVCDAITDNCDLWDRDACRVADAVLRALGFTDG